MSKDILRNNSKNDGETMPPKSLDALRTKRRRGVVVAGVAASAVVGAGLGANFLDHETGVVAEGKVKPGSSTEATILDWDITSDILAARGEFETNSEATIDVNMKFQTIANNLPGIVGDAAEAVGDAVVLDYTQDQSVNCSGKIQEIIPADAVEKQATQDSLNLTIDASKIELNTYCDSVEAEVDPSTKKSFNEGWVVVSDAARLIKGDVPKPDEIMNRVSDNAKNALTTESLISMSETCGPEMAPLLEESAKEGLKQAAVNLSDVPAEKIKVEVSYENGPIDWVDQTESQIDEIKSGSFSGNASIDEFDFDKSSCDLSQIEEDLEIVGKAEK